MEQFRALSLIEQAAAEGYAVGAFNVHNPETTEALIEASIKAKSPVFLQVGRAVIPHMGLKNAYEMTRSIRDEYGVDAPIHLDHGTYEEVLEALQLGFDSIMFDGSHLDFEENINLTKKVVSLAHEYGIPVEAELGQIPDASNDIRWADVYTKPNEAERFVAETGVDLLAISAGVMHGVPSAEPQPLDIELISEIKNLVGIPLVLHGASGVPADQLQAAVRAGVSKLNADTDLRHAFRRGIELAFSSGDRQLEEALTEGKGLMIDATIVKMQEYGCAGKLTSLDQGVK